MSSDGLDKRMRVFETAHDHSILPSLYTVVRLDGRNFSKLTSDLQVDKPMDEGFRDHMLSTTLRLMDCGVHAVFGYTQSDEISILLHPDCNSFGRKLRKLNSVLAGEASAHMSLKLGQPAVFDCRISQLPTEALVVDYFRWRIGDAIRNGLNVHAYWLLRDEGLTATETTERLRGLKTSELQDLLYAHGLNFNDLPAWKKQGTGATWVTYEKRGVNPITGDSVTSTRRRLTPNFSLPVRDELFQYIRDLVPARSL
jgi:tRNA(His) 5'-end guanylyltransferase